MEPWPYRAQGRVQELGSSSVETVYDRTFRQSHADSVLNTSNNDANYNSTIRQCSLLMAYTHACIRYSLNTCFQSVATRGHVANCHISISLLLSLRRHSHYDVIHLGRAQPPF